MGDFIDLMVSNAIDVLLDNGYNPFGKGDEDILSYVLEIDCDLKKDDVEVVLEAIRFYRERNNI